MPATEKEKEAQEARAKKYGVAIKEGGHVTKPSEYAHLPDERFADPVNYRYPIDEAHIRAAASYWGIEKNRQQYSSSEQAIISERIEKAKKKFNIGEFAENKDFVFVNCIHELSAEVPTEIQILPVGLFVHPKHGPVKVTEQMVREIIDNSKEYENDIVIDYEHQTLKDMQAPAAAWIKKLTDKGRDGLWVAVEWTKKAAEYIRNREYKYLSPVIVFGAKSTRTGKRMGTVLHSIGLTNVPVIDGMVPLFNKEEVRRMDFIKRLKSILGLDAGVNEDEIITNVEEMKKTGGQVACKEVLEVLKLEEGATLDEVKTKIVTMKDSASVQVASKEVLEALELKEGATLEEVKGKIIAMKSPDGYVNREEFNTLKGKLDTQESEAIVNKAMADGKVSPASKDWALDYAKKDPGGFKKYLEKAPVVVPLKDRLPSQPPRKNVPELDETQEVVNKQLGVPKEDFKKFGKEENADDAR